MADRPTIFPALIPDNDTYDVPDLMSELDASTLQGIAAAHTTDKINGQSSAWEISDFLTGQHTTDEIDGMVDIVLDSEPPRSEVDLSPAFNDDGTLSQYQ